MANFIYTLFICIPSVSKHEVHSDPTSLPLSADVWTAKLAEVIRSRIRLRDDIGALNSSVSVVMAATKVTCYEPLSAIARCCLQAIIVAEQLLAAEVLSECVLLTDTEFSKDDAGAATFSACPQLVSRWGCFRTRCLYSHIQEFECFNIHAPTKKEEMGVKQAIVIV